MTAKEKVVAVTLAVTLAATAYGFWLAWRPLGFIVGGLLFAVFAVLVGVHVPDRDAR